MGVKLVSYLVGSTGRQIQTMLLEAESRLLAWNCKLSGRKLSWISNSTSSMSRTLKWSAGEARRAKVLDVMGIWNVMMELMWPHARLGF